MNRIYYINHKDNHTYRQDTYGFDVDTNQKRVVLKDIATGERWDMPIDYLSEKCTKNGCVINIWERMPDGWHPTERWENSDIDYPGYTNDPRKETNAYGYNVHGVRTDYRPAPAHDPYRKRPGFRGR